MRQVMVFSTSLGPRPGACVPTTRTGGVSSGKVSTLRRGITWAANTTKAMETIRIAIGLRRDRWVTGLCSGGSAWRLGGSVAQGGSGGGLGDDLVALLQLGAAVEHDPRAGGEGRVQEELPPALSKSRPRGPLRRVARAHPAGGLRPRNATRGGRNLTAFSPCFW